MSAADPGPLVLYDQDCGLCLRSVRFLLEREPARALRFAPLASALGQRACVAAGLAPEAPGSLILVEGDGLHLRSEAALRLARHLSSPWRWLGLLRIVPTALRDRLYDLVAARRGQLGCEVTGAQALDEELRLRTVDADPRLPEAPLEAEGDDGEAPLPGPLWVADPSVQVRPLRPLDRPAAERIVSLCGGAIFQRDGWRRAVARTFGHTDHSLGAWRDGELVGVLPLMRCSGLLGGRNLISTPYGVYGGPLSPDPRACAALVQAGRREAASLGVGRLELRSREPVPCDGLVQSDLYVTFEKELPESYEEVLKGMKKDERRLVRRAADTHELEVQEGEAGLDALVELFHASKRRLGSPGLPGGWFEALIEELPGQVVLHRVLRRGVTLAVSLSFLDGDSLRMYYIGVEEGANEAYATTSFLIAELQRWSIERGLRVFDLGRSRSDAGAARFKRNQGFRPAQLHYAYGLERDQGLPSFHPSNPRTAALRSTWSRLPAPLCRGLSGFLAPYLP